MAALSAFVSTSQGAVTFFNDFSAWSNEAPSALTHSIASSTDSDQQIVNGVATDVVGPVNVLYRTAGNVDRVNNHIEFDNALLNFTLDTAGDNQTTEVTFSFDAPIAALGFDVLGLSTAGSGWIFDVDGQNFALADVIGASGGFAGFVSDTPISSISLVATPLTSGGDQIQFTNFYTQPVPEPSTGALFGLLGASVLLRRQRR